MDNFDMSSVVRDMEIIKNQMKIMQEVQEASLTVHAALCGDKSREHEDVQTNVERSPAPSTGTTPPRQTPHTPVMSPQLCLYLLKFHPAPFNNVVSMTMVARMRTYYVWHKFKDGYPSVLGIELGIVQLTEGISILLST